MSEQNFGYDPFRVRSVLEELESNSTRFSNSELQSLVLAREYLDTDKEVPRWLLVKLSMMSRKLR